MKTFRRDWAECFARLVVKADSVCMTVGTYNRLYKEGLLDPTRNFKPSSDAVLFNTNILGHALTDVAPIPVMRATVGPGNLVRVKGKKQALYDLFELTKLSEGTEKPRRKQRVDQAEDKDKNSVVRVKLDFMVEMDGPRAIPDEFSSKTQDFLMQSIRKAKIPVLNLLGGTRVEVSVVNMRNLLRKKAK